jgi:hypothetical protein
MPGVTSRARVPGLRGRASLVPNLGARRALGAVTMEQFIAATTGAAIKLSERELLQKTLTGRLTIPAFAEFEKVFQAICTTVETFGVSCICTNREMHDRPPSQGLPTSHQQ